MNGPDKVRKGFRMIFESWLAVAAALVVSAPLIVGYSSGSVPGGLWSVRGTAVVVGIVWAITIPHLLGYAGPPRFLWGVIWSVYLWYGTLLGQWV